MPEAVGVRGMGNFSDLAVIVCIRRAFQWSISSTQDYIALSGNLKTSLVRGDVVREGLF